MIFVSQTFMLRENHGKCTECDATGIRFPNIYYIQFNVPMNNIFCMKREKMNQLATVVTKKAIYYTMVRSMVRSNGRISPNKVAEICLKPFQ